jgi:hypothetical protein
MATGGHLLALRLLGVGFLLVLGPVVATPAFLALALWGAGEIRAGRVLAGVVAGTFLATPLISRGYHLGETVGFPFLGALGGATLVVLSAYGIGRAVGKAASLAFGKRR